jgi:hypothetical protein
MFKKGSFPGHLGDVMAFMKVKEYLYEYLFFINFIA